MPSALTVQIASWTLALCPWHCFGDPYALPLRHVQAACSVTVGDEIGSPAPFVASGRAVGSCPRPSSVQPKAIATIIALLPCLGWMLHTDRAWLHTIAQTQQPRLQWKACIALPATSGCYVLRAYHVDHSPRVLLCLTPDASTMQAS